MTDDTDLTDPHGEAEALRRENARLKVKLDRREKLLDSVILERTHYRKRAEAAEAALAAIRALPAAPAAEAQPAIGGAELDALVARLLDGPSRVYRDVEADKRAADAITALRAQPAEHRADDDLRALLARVPSALNSAFGAGIEEREGGSARRQAKLMEPVDKLRDDIRSALSDLAKMKGE